MLPATAARAIIEAWREQQADRLAPVRFRFIDALERRAASHDGETRRLLDERLSSLLTAYAGDLAALAAAAEASVMPRDPKRGPLGELSDYIASHRSTQDGGLGTFGPIADSPAMPALEEFRKTWTAVRSESRLRQSMAFEPTNAGPLNSAALVHRSMALMRELSPGYLQHFLAYVDDLSWLEQIDAGAGKAVARSTSPTKRGRKKSAGMTPGNAR